MSNIEKMVNRFLGWKLPKDFCPDAGISFKPTKPYEGDEFGNSWWPVGTNLLTAEQARQMFEHVTADESAAGMQPHQQRVVTEKAETLRGLVEAFVKAQGIHCAETIYQSDRVVENACQFIESLCDVVGYLSEDEEE